MEEEQFSFTAFGNFFPSADNPEEPSVPTGPSTGDGDDEGYGRKVDWCSDCQTADFEDHEIPTETNDKGKTIKFCPFCGHRLSKRNEERINEFTEKPVLGDMFSRHTYVTRIISSPWGRMQLHLSTDSPHCYFANVRSGDSGDYTTPVNVIRQLINENFSQSASMAAFKESGISILQYSGFVDHLQVLVRGLLRDSDPAGFRDLTLESDASTPFALSGGQQ